MSVKSNGLHLKLRFPCFDPSVHGLIMVMCVMASLDGSSSVVLTVATIPADPSESPFGYPAFGQYDESFYVHRSQYEM